MPKKKNAKGAGTIRQRKDGRWEARITLGYNPGTGRQTQRSIYGATQEEVLKKMREVQYSIDTGTYTEPLKTTLSQWMDTWLSEYTGNVKELTLDSYQRQITNHIVPALGKVRLQALTSPQIQGFYNSLTKGKHLSPKTVKNIHGVLHKALSIAVKIGYLRFNPADNVILPKVVKKEITIIADDDLPAFLKAIKGHRFERVYIADLFIGFREGEILGLPLDCIDFKNGLVHLKYQLLKEKKKGGVYKLAPLKNDKQHTVAPAQFVMDVLHAQYVHQKEMQLRAGSAWNNKWSLLFTDELGNHLKHGTVYKNLKKILRQIGRGDACFHSLRHSYAVMALRSGDDIKTVQDTLGHHSAAFTLDVYGHVSDQMKKESAARMDRFIRNIQVN